MSDTGSSRNAEDVLASVRRLVAAELPKRAEPELRRRSAALVLTESQRIEDGDAPEGPPVSLEERIAELEAAVGARDEDWEPDGSEDQSLNRPDRIVFKPSDDSNTTRPVSSTVSRQPRRLSQIALIETGPANEMTPAERPAAIAEKDASFRHGGDDRPDRLHDALRQVIRESLPRGDAFDQALARAVTSRVIPNDENAGTEETNAETGYDDQGADETSALQSTPSETADTEDDAASWEVSAEELNDAVARSEQPKTDDDAVSLDAESSEDDPDQVAMTAAPEAIDETVIDAVADTETATVEPEPAAADVPFANVQADLLDVEALRPIVAALIREELKGELGERITRNVRKLVRREILRALSAQDLE